MEYRKVKKSELGEELHEFKKKRNGGKINEKKICKNNWNIDDVLHSSNADGMFGGGNGKLQYVKTGRLF